jgi:pyruvate kinase
VHHPHRLVVTLGPASWQLVRELRAAGADAFRINASHLSADALDHALGDIRRDVPDAEIVVDLQGAKMRIGQAAPRDLHRGERVRFALDTRADALPVPHPELFAQARPGHTVGVDDGRLRLRVTGAATDHLELVALDAGRVLPRKGVTLEEHPVRLDGLTAADRDAIAAATPHGVREFAFSFMSDGREADWVRALAPASLVVGKVERREAADALATLAARVDAVWICRGDLGAQLLPAGLARFVASVEPSRLPVPVLMAGQVLEHLTAHVSPTRSEVCHVFDLVARGYRGFVLSDETAVGIDPVNAAAAAASLLRDFQSLYTAG